MNRRYAWHFGSAGAGETVAMFHVKQAHRSVGTLGTTNLPPLPAAPAIADPKRSGRWGDPWYNDTRQRDRVKADTA